MSQTPNKDNNNPGPGRDQNNKDPKNVLQRIGKTNPLSGNIIQNDQTSDWRDIQEVLNQQSLRNNRNDGANRSPVYQRVKSPVDDLNNRNPIQNPQFNTRNISSGSSSSSPPVTPKSPRKPISPNQSANGGLFGRSNLSPPINLSKTKAQQNVDSTLAGGVPGKSTINSPSANRKIDSPKFPPQKSVLTSTFDDTPYKPNRSNPKDNDESDSSNNTSRRRLKDHIKSTTVKNKMKSHSSSEDEDSYGFPTDSPKIQNLKKELKIEETRREDDYRFKLTDEPISLYQKIRKSISSIGSKKEKEQPPPSISDESDEGVANEDKEVLKSNIKAVLSNPKLVVTKKSSGQIKTVPQDVFIKFLKIPDQEEKKIELREGDEIQQSGNNEELHLYMDGNQEVPHTNAKVIREKPPRLLNIPDDQVIDIPGRVHPAPRAKIVIHKAPDEPADGQPIRVETWLLPNHRNANIELHEGRRIIPMPDPDPELIEYEDEIRYQQRYHFDGIEERDPDDYIQTHGRFPLRKNQLPPDGSRAHDRARNEADQRNAARPDPRVLGTNQAINRFNNLNLNNN